MAIKTFKRVEKKYIINSIQKEALETIINEHLEKDKYCRENPYYLVRNIYYDTVYRDLIHHSILKPYHKEKIRVRKYGSYDAEKNELFLEIKKKTGGVVSKRRVKLTQDELEIFLNTRKYQENKPLLDLQVLKEFEYYLSIYKIQPTVFISYKRSAYFGKENKNFRITFDFDIQYNREKLDFSYHNDNVNLLEKDLCIMEIKIENSMPLWLAHALTKLKIYPNSFSKYGQEYKSLIKEEQSNVRLNITR